MRKLSKYLALPAEDRRLLRGASWRLLLAWAALKVLPLPRLLATLERRGVDCRPHSPEATRRVARAVEVAARNWPIALTCLPQGLATCWMLQSAGAAPHLHYGVQAIERQGGVPAITPHGFRAHAWVELDGQPVIGHRVAQGFTTLAVFPHDERR